MAGAPDSQLVRSRRHGRVTPSALRKRVTRKLQYLRAAIFVTSRLRPRGRKWRSRRPSRPFKLSEPHHRLRGIVAAHFARWSQAPAEGRSLGAPENTAAHGVVELYAGHAGGLAVRHAGDRTRDRWRDAAGAALRSATGVGRPGRVRARVSGGRHAAIVLPGGEMPPARLKSGFLLPVSALCAIAESRGALQCGSSSRSGRDGSDHAQ